MNRYSRARSHKSAFLPLPPLLPPSSILFPLPSFFFHSNDSPESIHGMRSQRSLSLLRYAIDPCVSFYPTRIRLYDKHLPPHVVAAVRMRKCTCITLYNGAMLRADIARRRRTFDTLSRKIRRLVLAELTRFTLSTPTLPRFQIALCNCLTSTGAARRPIDLKKKKCVIHVLCDIV